VTPVAGPPCRPTKQVRFDFARAFSQIAHGADWIGMASRPGGALSSRAGHDVCSESLRFGSTVSRVGALDACLERRQRPAPIRRSGSSEHAAHCIYRASHSGRGSVIPSRTAGGIPSRIPYNFRERFRRNAPAACSFPRGEDATQARTYSRAKYDTGMAYTIDNAGWDSYWRIYRRSRPSISLGGFSKRIRTKLLEWVSGRRG